MSRPIVVIDGVRYVPEQRGPAPIDVDQVLLLVTVNVYGGGGADAAVAALSRYEGTFDAPSDVEVEIVHVEPGSPR